MDGRKLRVLFPLQTFMSIARDIEAVQRCTQWISSALGRHTFRWGAFGGALLLVLHCDGSQSALAPAGREAEQIAKLFWWMAAGAVVIWLAMVGLGVYAVRVRPESGKRRANLLILGGGAILPTIVLAVLLAYGLWMLPGLVDPAPVGSLKIAISGEQWWWRVRYPSPGGEPIELANEIRLPVGEPVEFHLESSNVIHSFWVPSLGGKKDMVPGRVTRLALTPTRTGIFRGVCAEYCGASHALMSFDVAVMEKAEFSRWLAQQRNPAESPVTPLAARGQEQFLANGCGACHAISGLPATGVLGPNLTHVGSRLSLGAGILPNEVEAFRRFIGQTETLKPAVHMPSFGMLPREDMQALAAYLKGLK